MYLIQQTEMELTTYFGFFSLNFFQPKTLGLLMMAWKIHKMQVVPTLSTYTKFYIANQ